MEGDASRHLMVMQGVHSVPGVQGHQAHGPQAAGDPRALQAVHRGEPRHCGAPAPLAEVSLPADDDRPEHQAAGSHRAQPHLCLRRRVRVHTDVDFEVRFRGRGCALQ